MTRKQFVLALLVIPGAIWKGENLLRQFKAQPTAYAWREGNHIFYKLDFHPHAFTLVWPRLGGDDRLEAAENH